MADGSLLLQPVGWVSSPLTDPAAAPKQGDEGAPEAWISFLPDVADALRDLTPCTEVIVLTWLHRANRGTLVVRPRGDPNRLRVADLEALEGTPVLDVKPVLRGVGER
ncbi:MAG: tRNA (N6-threonylcarbamoyladenosine(37)-N6)-methyltransferase TrmO [Actinomycetota bacterium]